MLRVITLASIVLLLWMFFRPTAPPPATIPHLRDPVEGVAVARLQPGLDVARPWPAQVDIRIPDSARPPPDRELLLAQIKAMQPAETVARLKADPRVSGLTMQADQLEINLRARQPVSILRPQVEAMDRATGEVEILLRQGHPALAGQAMGVLIDQVSAAAHHPAMVSIVANQTKLEDLRSRIAAGIEVDLALAHLGSLRAALRRWLDRAGRARPAKGEEPRPWEAP